MRKWIQIVTVFWLISSISNALHETRAAPPIQSTQRITFGQTVNGTITNDQFRQLYVFTGRQGQVITIAMDKTEGDLDPYLILTNVDSFVLATSDDEGENQNALISSQSLPSDGDYIIIATRFAHGRGLTTGDFDLRLDLVGASAETANFSLQYGDSILGQITPTQTEIVYTLQARRGQVITIRMRRTSGDLDPLLDLFDPNRQLLITGDDDPDSFGSRNAAIKDFLILADGVYFLRATRYGYDGGTTIGTFILNITETPPETLGTRPLTARYISYGDTLTATIDNDVITRFFQFDATRGDVIAALVERQEGNISPQMSLLSAADLRAISISDSGPGRQTASLLVSIPETGRYLLAVTRYQGTQGTSVGEFSLNLTGRPGDAGDNRLEIIYGAKVNGIIDNERFQELYRFIGAEGDEIDIIMRRLEGDLDPLLTLMDENDKQLISNDDGFGADSPDARIQFRIPADGIYTIEASRVNRFAGTSSGIYELSLQAD